MLQTLFTGWYEWWETLPPEMAFLAALPFGVAAAAFASDVVGRIVAARPDANSEPADPRRQRPHL